MSGMNPLDAVGGTLDMFGIDPAKVPGLRELTGSRTDAEKQLLEKQKQLAEEARKRQLANEQARLNAMGQKMLAFNPQNQMMAQMYGPEAAFSPQQFAQMAQDPYAKTQEDFSRAHAESLRTGKPMQGMNQGELDRMRQNEQRQRMIQQNMQAPGPGPAPLQPRTPQAARRY